MPTSFPAVTKWMVHDRTAKRTQAPAAYASTVFQFDATKEIIIIRVPILWRTISTDSSHHLTMYLKVLVGGIAGGRIIHRGVLSLVEGRR